MATLPFFSPRFRAFDANGDSLAGGKLYSYAAGTSTPLDTYTTRGGTIANTNPVVLDANGEADVWTTPGVLYKFVLKNSSDVTQWTVDNVPSGSEETTATDLADTLEPGGRLSLTTGTPITTSDVTGAATLFYVPHRHSKVPLYDGTTWALRALSAELSQAASDTTKSPGASSADNNYDVFIWDDSGTLRLSRGPAWASATSRGAGTGTTELERIGARYVNKVAISNGPAAQRGLYVGTVRAVTSGLFTDSLAKRYVWNAYNRVRRLMNVPGNSSVWTYYWYDEFAGGGALLWRQANGSASHQLEYVAGLSEDPVRAEIQIDAKCSNSSLFAIGIGLDSTSVRSGVASGFSYNNPSAERQSMSARYEGFPGIGKHTLAWLEASENDQTVTFLAGTSGEHGAMFGHLYA